MSEQVQSKGPDLFLAGGATGGHIWAGVSVAEEWKRRYPKSKILFIGARGGLEERLVPKAGFALELLSVGSLNGVGLVRQVRTFLKLPFAFAKSLVLLLKFRPAVVLGVGGYASGPMVMTARWVGWLWGVKIAVLEQNVMPGMTNRILGRFSHQILAAFPETRKYFGSTPVLVTGNPIRTSMKPMAPAPRDPFTIFVFGGSQGAMGINTLVLDALPHLRGLSTQIRFIHQTGERDFDRVREGHARAESGARVEKFIYEMPEVYSQASLLICRAGSSTLSEIAAVRRAAILIPLVSADRHQEANAQVFSDRGAARVLFQKRSTGEDLARLICELMADHSQISRMEAAVAAFHHPAAAEAVVSGITQGASTHDSSS